MSYPIISIITPSYNQGQFIEETICSVLDQNYPNLEYIIIDGGSTDNTIDFIKKYEKHLAYWISEPDRGQTHAINKGLARITGDIWAYLNSDDLLCPGSLHRIAEAFHDPEVYWVGAVSSIIQDTQTIGYIKPQLPDRQSDYLFSWNREIKYVFPCSNVCFMRKEVLDKCGLFDEKYHYCMDIEYYVRTIFKGGFSQNLIPDVLGYWRWHEQSKTLTSAGAYGFLQDEIEIASHYLQYLSSSEQQQLKQSLEYHKKWVAPRKALYHQERGQKQQAIQELIAGCTAYPSSLWFRPWLGAAKQIIFNS